MTRAQPLPSRTDAGGISTPSARVLRPVQVCHAERALVPAQCPWYTACVGRRGPPAPRAGGPAHGDTRPMLSTRARLAAQSRRLNFRCSAAAGSKAAAGTVLSLPTPSTPPSPSWIQALTAPTRSEGAMAAAHDAAGAAHRRGGRAAPRSRWDEQEPPLGGWRPLI